MLIFENPYDIYMGLFLRDRDYFEKIVSKIRESESIDFTSADLINNSKTLKKRYNKGKVLLVIRDRRSPMEILNNFIEYMDYLYDTMENGGADRINEQCIDELNSRLSPFEDHITYIIEELIFDGDLHVSPMSSFHERYLSKTTPMEGVTRIKKLIYGEADKSSGLNSFGLKNSLKVFEERLKVKGNYKNFKSMRNFLSIRSRNFKNKIERLAYHISMLDSKLHLCLFLTDILDKEGVPIFSKSYKRIEKDLWSSICGV